MATALVAYHADCLDGFGAAWSAWRALGEAALYRPLHHGEHLAGEEIAGRDVYILDFSFAPAELEAMTELAHSVTQIDHHATAHGDWCGRLQDSGDGREIYCDPQRSLTVIFALDRAGAMLAWAQFHHTTPPLLLQHVEDLDLWRFALPGTRNFCRALRLQPFCFTIWERLAEELASPEAPAYLAFVERGAAVEQFHQNEVARLAAPTLSMPARLRGEPIDAVQARRHGLQIVGDEHGDWQAIAGLAVNAGALFASELGHRLAERSGSFGLTWQLVADGQVKVSLRSQTPFNVGDIARRYGGGGHPQAAGFRLPAAQFFAEILGLPR